MGVRGGPVLKQRANLRHRVLAALDPERPLTSREIAAAAGVGYGTVWRWLNQLFIERLADKATVLRPPDGRTGPFCQSHWRMQVWAPDLRPLEHIITGWSEEYREAKRADHHRESARRKRCQLAASRAADKESVLASAARRLERSSQFDGGTKAMSPDYLRRCRELSLRRRNHG